MGRWSLLLLEGVCLASMAGCEETPYDFPVPTVINGQRAYAMTGYLKATTEADVRARLERRQHCANGVEFLDLRTVRADRVGAKVMHYDVILRCRGEFADGPAGGESPASSAKP